ncbi:hypothetical protein MACH09_35700 [Vibrio sp. MACH09]|uniref:ABC transporter substrate binding protein n=1 Tax=unclassified Vibrio TaxID=2614977 RepID=UPI001493994A|nr:MULTISPECIES: ABC transporter substrate binding protein [unclassified Vibrio]NOI64726.1 hypothetical protein [Vibrio sp. 99-8-1]GLO63062.1 hypothetical protein MACH09_35700 [Vibrio sp. MACH09]
MSRQLIILLLLLCGISSVLAETTSDESWPYWLGNDVKVEAESSWNVSTSGNSLELSSISKQTKVWMILSKPAKSYDTALKTMLNVYKKQAENIQFRLFLLSDVEEQLPSWLNTMEQQADLLYTVGSKATATIYKQYAGGKVPVVSVNAKDPVLLELIEDYSGSGNNFAFTSLNLSASVTLSFIKKFDEELTQIGVLYAESNRSAYLTQYLPLKSQAEKQGMQVFALSVDEDDPKRQLQAVMEQQVNQMRKQDPTLSHSILWLTGSSSLLRRIGEINQYSAELPLLTAVPEAVNGSSESALMSVGTSFVNNAYQAALYGLKILNKEAQAKDLPVGVIYPPDISLNFMQAQRIDAVMPFILVEMASEIYAEDGSAIRSSGMSMEDVK